MPTPGSPWSSLTAERAAVAQRVIAAMAGPDARLREDQEIAVAALCEPGSRVLVVQATGWGKSAVYWAATAVRRSEGAGPTLVVSPLLSLMRDQVAAAGRAGLSAATLNSSNVDEWSSVEAALRAGEVDVLLVSPERLANPGFGRRVLDGLAGTARACSSSTRRTRSPTGATTSGRTTAGSPTCCSGSTRPPRCWRPPRPPTSGSPTTSPSSSGTATLVLRGQLARASLELSVVDRLSPLERYAWVVDHLPRLPGSGIVYTLTVADAERLAAAVRDVHGDAVPVAAYTGQLDARGGTSSRTRCATTGSRRWSPPRRSAWATTSPTSAS